MQFLRMRRLAVAAGIGVVLMQAQTAHAILAAQEGKCSAAISKNIEKLNATILKETSRCRAADISGDVDSTDRCQTLPAKSAEKIEGAKAKAAASIAKACQSTCSLSGKPCFSDLSCPPNNANAERCTGSGGSKLFRIESLGFPGVYCPAILDAEVGRTSIESSLDVGTCVTELTEVLAADVVDNIYDELDETSSLSDGAQSCLAAISKAAGKALSKVHSAVAKCRISRQVSPVCDGGANDGESCTNDTGCPSGSCGLDPDDCLADPAVDAAVDKELTNLQGAVAKSCADSTVAELDGMCADGGASPSTVSEAQSCLASMVRELAGELRGPYRHTYSSFGMVNVSHPETAFGYCGDGLLDQERNESNWIGEECDGDADAACGSGSCLPPGDLFECTCDNIARYRMVIDGERVDSDAGWTGDSHDATHNDNFGYIADLTSCDCASFDQATCSGGSDPICDMEARTGPRCSNQMDSSQFCDDIGDGDSDNEDSDCMVCDQYSTNAGTYCADGGGEPDETVCGSQCFDDLTGMAVGLCGRQSDCAAGQTCKGRCDDGNTCEELLEGSPLPQVSAAISVCIGLEYVTDVVGTKDMVTGESALDYMSRSVVHLGEATTQPCPVCAGSCIGGDNDGLPCSGRCDVSGDECLFDSDCTGPGDTACLESAADCPSGACSLDLRCSSGDNSGQFCRPMANTPLGTVSADCPPSSASNLSGVGVQQPFGTVTTEAKAFPAGGACSDPAWANLTCPCPDGGSSTKTKPNQCAATCSGGVNEGKPCAVSANSTGVMTKCSGGSEAGAICDEDSDCSGGGTCTANPSHCTAGNPTLLGSSCTANAQCDTSLGSGDGICQDACPGAKCLPLCYPQGECDGGTRDGLECSQDNQCDGGGTCEVSDAEDGLCANGPMKWRCTGAGFTTLPCSFVDEHTDKGCESGGDGILGNEDDIPGAGLCERRPLDCYVNNGATEGWDTINGLGDASNVKMVATFCTPPAGNPAVNSISGFGGPSRTRRVGQGFVNVDSIP